CSFNAAGSRTDSEDDAERARRRRPPPAPQAFARGRRANGWRVIRCKAFAKACRDLKTKHIRTKPYTPKTNGKAERFIQTAPREWAYARAYNTSDERAADLPLWSHLYNWHRPHGGIKDKTPISRLGLNRDNLLRRHS
ncbi:MAG: integrase core domain-containing protein, partial [Pseudomonadota bacterium]